MPEYLTKYPNDLGVEKQSEIIMKCILFFVASRYMYTAH